jgi:hypothetical protein
MMMEPKIGQRARGKGAVGTITDVGESPSRGGTMIVVQPDDGRRPIALYDGEYEIVEGGESE